MRMDPRYNRVKSMLSVDEIPKHSNGGIGLCHACQRAVFFSNGYLRLLIKDLKNLANAHHIKAMQGGVVVCPRCGSDERYEKQLKTRIKYTCKQCKSDYTRHSSSEFASPKITEQKRNDLFEALKTKSVRQAAKDSGVSYKTAHRMKGFQDDKFNALEDQ